MHSLVFCIWFIELPSTQQTIGYNLVYDMFRLTRVIIRLCSEPLLTYLLHGAESFLISWPGFAASQEIPGIFMEPESSLPYSQVPATCPYPEPTPSSPHDSLQLPEDPS